MAQFDSDCASEEILSSIAGQILLVQWLGIKVLLGVVGMEEGIQKDFVEDRATR